MGEGLGEVKTQPPRQRESLHDGTTNRDYELTLVLATQLGWVEHEIRYQKELQKCSLDISGQTHTWGPAPTPASVIESTKA